MSKKLPSRSYGVASPRFWRNVTLIALAHVALIAGLIRWSLAARSAPDPEALVWLSGADELAAERSAPSGAPPEKISAPPIESGPLKPDETEKKRPSVAQAKSEIDLPTPRPTPVATPISKTITPAERTQPTPKSAPRPTPKKTVLVKAPKSPTHANPSLRKSNEKQTDSSKQEKKSAKTVSAKTKSSADNASGKTGSAGKAGSTSGGSNASEFGWYGNMLHDRFYSAWIQPTSTVASGAKISTLVKVRIEKDGRVSKFDVIKPSENVVVNESVAAIAKRVTEVDPPPTGLANGNHYDVKINFELNTNQETER
jgi:outer membrane biosynthesis protein TonB